MIQLAALITELPALLEQLESASVRPGRVADTKWFEWRIRARLVEEKLLQTAKPPNPSSGIEPLPGRKAIPFNEASAAIARRAIPHASGLRVALENRRVQAALDCARAIERAIGRGPATQAGSA